MGTGRSYVESNASQHQSTDQLNITSHGCSTKIFANGKTVFHRFNFSSSDIPIIRSYEDGIKVGCTFITNEAVELIYNLHKSFLDGTNSKTHQ